MFYVYVCIRNILTAVIDVDDKTFIKIMYKGL